jgi:hypothetical protein
VEINRRDVYTEKLLIEFIDDETGPGSYTAQKLTEKAPVALMMLTGSRNVMTSETDHAIC